MRAAMVYRGSHASATRADFGPLSPDAPVVDWWVLRQDPDRATHLTVRPFVRGGVVRAHVVRICGSLWDAQREPIPNPDDVIHYFVIVELDQSRVREIARHLARNMANGTIAMEPRTVRDRVTWERAVGAAEAFVERFGPPDAMHRERV